MGILTEIEALLDLPKMVRAIEKKVNKIMSQIEELAAVLSEVQNGVNDIQEKAEQLAADLKVLQDSTPPETDLTDVLAQAEAIRDDLNGVSQSVTDAPTGE